MAEIEAKCQLCGKPVSVLEPSRWGYKVKEKNGWIYYCSWKCLRADEKRIEQAEQKKKEARKAKQQEKFLNNRLEVLKGMMEAVSEGKNAYDYLKSMGYADPKDTLRRLRITAKEEAPKIYRKMEKMGLLDLRKGHSGKGADRMSQNKLTREQKEKAVQIALNGGDYLEHLKKCGAKNPSAAWWYIRKTLGKSNPELLEEINKKTGEGAEIEVAEKLPEEATITGEEKEQLDELTRDGMPLEEAMESIANVEAPQPMKFEGMKVTAVEQDGFQIQREGKNGEKITVYWPLEKDAEGITLIFKQMTTLGVNDWKKFMKIMPKAMRILGVDAG